MYSKEQYKSEQQPGDQLLGGSTALCCSPGASREKRKKLSERETVNAVEKKGKEGEGEREWGPGLIRVTIVCRELEQKDRANQGGRK